MISMAFPYVPVGSEPPELLDFVRQHFDELFNFDLGEVQVPLPLVECSIFEINDVRASFVVQMHRDEMVWKTGKIMRCVAFLTVDVILPALTVCKSMEGTVTLGRGSGDGPCQPVQLLHLGVGDTQLPRMPETLPFSKSHRRMRASLVLQGRGRARRMAANSAHSMASSLLESLAPGRAVWERDSSGCEDLFQAISSARGEPETVKSLQSLIATYAGQLHEVRRKSEVPQDIRDIIGEDDKTTPLGFQEFVRIFLTHFVMEAGRILLECMVNSPRADLLIYPAPAEMFYYPQMSSRLRQLELEIILEYIYNSVNDFTALAVEKVVEKANQRVFHALPFFGVDIEDAFSEAEVAKGTSVNSAVPLMLKTPQAHTSGGQRQSARNGRRRRIAISFRRFFRLNRGQSAVDPNSAAEEEECDVTAAKSGRRRRSLGSRAASALRKLFCCCRAQE
ncbi:uncharacterized protein LOC134468425 isoform X2 [Engraulis encrasicolus]|uniref:uncharacterized protein LOC134468425 isoform X2 n=1 Tax=Engraulis encrasicolus TaxID=184585 RepID=UPI002FCF401E